MSFKNNSKQTQKQNGGEGFRTKLHRYKGFKKYKSKLGRYIVINDPTKPFEFEIDHDWQIQVSDDLNKFVIFILEKGTDRETNITALRKYRLILGKTEKLVTYKSLGTWYVKGADSGCSPSKDPERFEGLTNDKLTTFENYCKTKNICDELDKKEDKKEDKSKKRSSKKNVTPKTIVEKEKEKEKEVTKKVPKEISKKKKVCAIYGKTVEEGCDNILIFKPAVSKGSPASGLYNLKGVMIEKKNQNISWEKKTPYIKTTDNNNARVKVKCQNSICLQKQEEEFVDKDRHYAVIIDESQDSNNLVLLKKKGTWTCVLALIPKEYCIQIQDDEKTEALTELKYLLKINQNRGELAIQEIISQISFGSVHGETPITEEDLMDYSLQKYWMCFLFHKIAAGIRDLKPKFLPGSVLDEDSRHEYDNCLKPREKRSLGTLKNYPCVTKGGSSSRRSSKKAAPRASFGVIVKAQQKWKSKMNKKQTEIAPLRFFTIPNGVYYQADHKLLPNAIRTFLEIPEISDSLEKKIGDVDNEQLWTDRDKISDVLSYERFLLKLSLKLGNYNQVLIKQCLENNSKKHTIKKEKDGEQLMKDFVTDPIWENFNQIKKTTQSARKSLRSSVSSTGATHDTSRRSIVSSTGATLGTSRGSSVSSLPADPRSSSRRNRSSLSSTGATLGNSRGSSSSKSGISWNNDDWGFSDYSEEESKHRS